MANWNKEMVTPEQINGGNEFTPNDNLSVTELNAIVNNSFFSAETANEAKEIAEQAKDASDNFVSYSAQTPTDEQKAQARANIGAVAKAINPTENNLASLDAEGNVKDSGIASDTVASKTNVNYLSMCPSGTYVAIAKSTAAGAITYTAPANGYVVLNAQNGSEAGRYFLENKTLGLNSYAYVPAYTGIAVFIPCAKGNSIAIENEKALSNLWLCRFVYAKEVE